MGKVKPAGIMLSVCEREHEWASRGIGRRLYMFIVERQSQVNRLSNNEGKKKARGAEDVEVLRSISEARAWPRSLSSHGPHMKRRVKGRQRHSAPSLHHERKSLLAA